MFLRVVHPLTGESLSSWRQRLAMKNGFRLFPCAQGEQRYADSDLSPSDETIAWLSELGGISGGILRQHTLRGLQGGLLTFGQGRAAPRWVVPLHASRRDRSFGMQYCPLCLAGDELPHFRLHWRLAFSTCCHIHSAMMLDECPKCGLPAWPTCSVLPELFQHKPSQGIERCALCGFDLRDAFSHPAHSQVHHFLDPNNLGEIVTLGTDTRVPAAEFVSVLWETCQLFVRNRPASLLASQNTELGAIAQASLRIDAKSIEGLPISIRHDAVNAAVGLFLSWPTKFVEVANTHGISAMHFSECRSSLPSWFLSVVDRELALQKRRITQSDVVAACKAVLQSGRKITRAELGRVLGSKDVRAVLNVTTTRDEASIQESIEFLRQLDRFVKERLGRVSSSEMRLRNAIVLGLCIGMQASVTDVLKSSREEVLAQSQKLASESNRFSRQVGCFISKWIRKYDRLRGRRGDKRPVLPDEPYFESFRGGPASDRTISVTMRRCMKALDPKLKRSIQVFSAPLKVSSSHEVV